MGEGKANEIVEPGTGVPFSEKSLSESSGGIVGGTDHSAFAAARPTLALTAAALTTTLTATAAASLSTAPLSTTSGFASLLRFDFSPHRACFGPRLPWLTTLARRIARTFGASAFASVATLALSAAGFGALRLWAFPIDHQDFADMIDGRGTGVRTDGAHQVFALVRILDIDANFDQFMRFERVIDFLQHAGGKAIVADHDRRFERMRARLKRPPLGRAENFIHSTIFRFEEPLFLRICGPRGDSCGKRLAPFLLAF
jgi:hypothetical protein